MNGIPPRGSMLFVVLLSLAVATAAAEEPPKVERLAIVDRAIEHHGGELYERSRTAMRICSRSGCFDLAVRRDGGLFEYDVAEGGADGAGRRTRVSNDAVESFAEGAPVALDGEAAQRGRDFANARVWFPFLPYGLNAPAVYKQDLGLERWGERELHKVKVTFAPGSSTDADDQYLFWFDPESGRLEQLAYDYGRGDGAGVRFRRLSNYRRVGGILFADQSNLGAEAPEITVDVVTPASVEGMREVSTVTLSAIEVEPLER